MTPTDKLDQVVVVPKLPLVAEYAHYILDEEEMTNFVLALLPTIFEPVTMAFIIQSWPQEKLKN